MPSIPWKYICIYLLFHNYGPEITPKTYEKYSKLFSKEYCKDHKDKTQCIFEQVRSLVSLGNDTYHTWFANITTYIENSGIKQAIEKYYNSYFTSEKKDRSNMYKPSSGEVKVNVSTAMSGMLDQMQETFKKTLPGDSANEIKQRLKTVAMKYRNTNSFCNMKLGVDPLDVLKLIDHVAQMTNMPRNLQNILENTINVIDADGSMAKNERFAFDGKVHYVLMAAYRNGKINNSTV
jgi:hypothetical protein